MKHITLSIAGITSLVTVAQPVLTVDDLQENIGVQVPLYVGNYYNPGPATNNFTLNRGNAVLGTPTGSEVVDPDATPYGSSFPQANIASRGITDTTLFNYGLLNASGLYSYGRYGPTEHVILNNPELQFRLPMSLGDTWTDQWSGAGTNGGQNFSRSGTTTGTYNGYGNVTTPFGSFQNVARIQVDQNYYDIQTGVEVNFQTTNVYYYISGFNRPIFSTSRGFVDLGLGAGLEQIISFATFADPSAVGIEEDGAQPLPVSVHPNPADDLFHVSWTGRPGAVYAIDLLDATGRMVSSSVPNLTTDLSRATVNVADLPGGVYLMRLSEAGRPVRVVPVMIR